jgi:hypothetical protein
MLKLPKPSSFHRHHSMTRAASVISTNNLQAARHRLPPAQLRPHWQALRHHSETVMEMSAKAMVANGTTKTSAD